jgi:hypothetical protein
MTYRHWKTCMYLVLMQTLTPLIEHDRVEGDERTWRWGGERSTPWRRRGGADDGTFAPPCSLTGCTLAQKACRRPYPGDIGTICPPSLPPTPRWHSSYLLVFFYFGHGRPVVTDGASRDKALTLSPRLDGQDHARMASMKFFFTRGPPVTDVMDASSSRSCLSREEPRSGVRWRSMYI